MPESLKLEQARRQQAQSDARYRRLMDNSAVAMCIADADGRFEIVNKAMCRFFGYTEEQMLAKDWGELVIPEMREAVLAEYHQFLAGETDYQRSIKECLNSGGERIWGDFSISCLRKPNGRLEQLLLYSDGAYELPTPDDSTWYLSDLVGPFTRLAQSPDWSLDTLIDQLRSHAQNRYFDDDCSLVRLRFS